MHNPELTDIYRTHFLECGKTVDQIASSGIQPTNPLLISPPKDYYKSDFKVMYFGQETNSWGGLFDQSKGVDHLLDVYDRFANEGGAYRYGGAFWNAIKRLNQHFSNQHASPSFIYNNIIKIGKHEAKGLPPATILNWQKTWFQVIREEVRLLAPDLIVFFTGPRYDRFLEEAFGPIVLLQIAARTTRQLSRVQAKGLPKNAFRTYHPNYLWRHDFYSYQRDIVDAMRS